MKKKHLLACIKDSLTNTRLVITLSETLSLNANDYYLTLPETLLEILNINIEDDVFEEYLDLYKKVQDIDVLNDSDALDKLIEDIYQELIKLSQKD